MENQQINQEGNSNEQTKKGWQSWLTLKTAIPICALIILLAVAYYYRGLFVAATVNGSPISRFAVIGELEKQSGKQTLDSLVTKKLIEAEVNKNNITVSQADIDAEVKKIEQQVAGQGGTLDMALQQQGMTREQFLEQITVQKKLEKLLADKTAVTDQEVDAYIKDNKVTPPAGQKIEDVKAQLKSQLQQKKFNEVAQQWITDLKTNAKIKFYVNY